MSSSLVLLFLSRSVSVYADCGWFVQEAGGQEQIFGMGYCFAAFDGDEESYSYDCVNGSVYRSVWNGNVKCQGNATSTAADGECSGDLRCHCVAAANSECEYFESKKYTTSSCSGNYATTANVVGECFALSDGARSRKIDCERDTLLVKDYDNTDCSGSVEAQDETAFPDQCIVYTCKGAASHLTYLMSLSMVVLMAVFV